eukprot:GHVU01024184.1.p1 GENE.GHVU01024184.1~~GHVU01024184.1.p1  ORF type:complete len:100 (-),score=0.37 GHVU01024184.1:66-365(-)
MRYQDETFLPYSLADGPAKEEAATTAKLALSVSVVLMISVCVCVTLSPQSSSQGVIRLDLLVTITLGCRTPNTAQPQMNHEVVAGGRSRKLCWKKWQIG